MPTIDDHLASFDGDVRQRLDSLRQAIAEEAPDAVETISYGIPTFDLGGEHLVHFAGFKGHVGLYPGPSGIEAFEAELAGYKKAKGSVQFPHDRPMPLDLVRRIVRFRVAEVRNRPQRAKRGRTGQA